MMGHGLTGGPGLFGAMSNGPTIVGLVRAEGIGEEHRQRTVDAGRHSPTYRADFAWIDGPMLRTYVPGTSNRPSGVSRIGNGQRPFSAEIEVGGRPRPP